MSLHIFKNKPSGVVLALLAIFVISFITTNLTYADVWDNRPYVAGRANGYSNTYFDNAGRLPTINGHCSGTFGSASVLPEIYSGDAIPPTVQSVGALVSFLRSYNQADASGSSCSRGKWINNGSAFIVQTMLGRNGDQANASGGRNISNADFDDLTRRLNAASINWNAGGTSTDGLNTWSMWNSRLSTVDVSHFQQTKTNTAIVITSAGGNVYKIFRQCANPIGNSNGVAAAPQDYALTPTISADKNFGQPGSTVTVSPYVNNVGSVASSNTQWQLSQFNVPSGGSYPGPGNSSSAPAPYYGNNLIRLNGGTGASYALGNHATGSSVLTLPDLPVGTRVCYAYSVQARAWNDTQWAHSQPFCVVIAKLPAAQVLGGDLRVGAVFAGSSLPSSSNIQTSVTIKDGKSYGSWAEYGIVAAGTVTGMASGSAYSGGLNCTLNCSTNTLSFANETSTIGKYAPTTNIPDVAATFPLSGTTPDFKGLADASMRRVETSSGDITISGGTIAKKQWLVINAPTKTVNITGDIFYDSSPLQSLSDIPQLVIIANQINITGNVKRVDAWLIASGSSGIITTCSSWKGSPVALSDKLTSNICSDPLVINGPVMAKQLYLRRTAGSDNGSKSGNPAEVINLRPDAYLWGLARLGDSGRLTTVYQTELPPRF